MSGRPPAAIALLIVAVVGLTGCRRESELLKQADVICAENGRAVAPIAERTSRALGRWRYDRVAVLVRRAIRLAAPGIRRLRALPEARRDAAFAAYLESLDARIAVLLRFARAAERRDVPALSAATADLAEADARSRQLAADYGFRVCSRG
jgi:hypothetical protein